VRQIAKLKVSLDPYWQASRRILEVIMASLPAGNGQRVKKASVDEVFFDLSHQVHEAAEYGASLEGGCVGGFRWGASRGGG
jgi:nucleotidyltransferase/DNA polymerase involved in DNA repair